MSSESSGEIAARLDAVFAKREAANLRALIENTTDSIWSVDAEYRLIAANSVMKDDFNSAFGVMLGPGTHMLETIPPALRPRWKERYDRALAGETHSAEEKFEFSDVPQFVNVTFVPIWQGDRVTGVSCRSTDITERMRLEQAIRLSEEKFSKAFHGSPDAVNINRLSDGIYLDINPGFTRLTGYTREEVLGRSSLPGDLGIWVRPEDRERTVQSLRAHGEAAGIQAPFRMKDGRVRVGLMSAKIIEVNGEPCILSITRDIDDRIREQEHRAKLEQLLLQAQKMESVGRLAGGVAHDFNNMLAPILGYTELLLEDPQVQGQHREYLENIHKAAERARDLTRKMLAFGRKQLLCMESQDLRHVVTELEPLLRRTLREDIALEVRLPSEPVPVCVDAGQIEQVITNLAVNAQDAIADAGDITIEVELVDLDESYVSVRPEVSPGLHAVLSVSDTGAGMDSETQAHLFEPFFTTKAAGKGTGLGLSTAYGIIKQHGGHISVSTEPAHGSTFKIILPALHPMDGVVAAAQAVSAPRAAPGSGETVLIVEDNAMVRQLTARMLTRLGYRVLDADSPASARKRVAEQGTAIALLLTDVVMPSMNGRELYRDLASLSPGLKVLYMSGYTEDAIAHHGVLDRGIDFIHKPFTISALGLKLRDVLDR